MLLDVHPFLPSSVGNGKISPNDAGLQRDCEPRAYSAPVKLASGSHLLAEGRPIPPIPPLAPPHINFLDAPALMFGGSDDAATRPAALMGTRTAPSGDAAARGVGVHGRAAAEFAPSPAEALRGGDRTQATARLTPADVAHLSALARHMPLGFGGRVS